MRPCILHALSLQLTLYLWNPIGSLDLPEYVWPSLFPKVPPYIRFQPTYKKVLIPSPISNHLLFPSATGHRKKLHDQAIQAAGLQLVPPHGGNLPILGWLRTPPTLSIPARRMRPKKWQKVNQFPGFSEVSLKDRMWLNLKKLKTRFPQVSLNFVPQTFILPKDAAELRRAWEKTENKLWMSKIPHESQGRGIRMLEHWRDFRGADGTVVQKYVHNPYLYDSVKVELQYTFVLTSVHPLRIYGLPEALKVKLGKSNYSSQIAFAQDKCIHNYDVVDCDRESFLFSPDAAALGQNMKEVLKKIDADFCMDKILYFMKEALILTLISAEPKLNAAFQKEAHSCYSHFHVMRSDFVLDASGKPWLLEINSSPIRRVTNAWLAEVEQNYYSEILNLAGYHFPHSMGPEAQEILRKYLNTSAGVVLDHAMYDMKLRDEDTKKQMDFLSKTERSDYLDEILDNLTFRERSMLMLAEDELHRVEVAQRIFPTKSTFKYLQFIPPSSAYYYKLFDAWEVRCAESRKECLILLQNHS